MRCPATDIDTRSHQADPEPRSDQADGPKAPQEEDDGTNPSGPVVNLPVNLP